MRMEKQSSPGKETPIGDPIQSISLKNIHISNSIQNGQIVFMYLEFYIYKQLIKK